MAVFLLAASSAALAHAAPCAPPSSPYLPPDSQDVRTYVDLLRGDFEAYIDGFHAYLRCLDAERARVMEEARAVTRDYAHFQALSEESKEEAGPGSM